LTVLRANHLATLLNPRLAAGRNVVRDAFLDPAFADLHPETASVRAECVAALRSVAGEYPDDAELPRLAAELSAHSEEFRALCGRADVRCCRTGKKPFNHPAVGTLCLDYETLEVGDTSGQRLLIHSAAPDTPDGDKLALLTLSTAGRTASDDAGTGS
jgi:hypothetical protein